MQNKQKIFMLALVILAAFAIFGCAGPQPPQPPQPPTYNYPIVAQGILNINQSLDFGEGKARLDDIPLQQTGKRNAFLSILDENGGVLTHAEIAPYTSYDQTYSSGAIYKIYIGETNSNWVQMIVYQVKNGTTVTPPTVRQIIVNLAGKLPSGNPSGNVKIVEYSDFQCPYCQRVEPTLAQVKSNYPNVALYFKQFPLPPSTHPNAQNAAEASLCADDQSKFWVYHDKLYANQQALDMASLKTYASQLEIDTTAFNTCLDNHEKATMVQAEQTEGAAVGVQGTPSFVIYSSADDIATNQKLENAVNSLNQQYSGLGAMMVTIVDANGNGFGNGVFFSGALPYEAFKTVLDCF